MSLVDVVMPKMGESVEEATITKWFVKAGDVIEDDDVLAGYQAIKQVDYSGREPTFFECTTAMALHEFRRQKVQWAIIETGMGGRLDSTNVVSPAVCGITSISYDHMESLGDTLALIAGEKAGI